MADKEKEQKQTAEPTAETQAGQKEVAPKKEKKPKKNEEALRLKEELDATKDLLSRTAAEFDNYKKRTARERLSLAEYTKAELIKQLLPILDNVDRAGAFDAKSNEYLKGIEMIVKQLSAFGEGIGMEEVAKKGDVFDPTCHEAVMHIEDEAYGESEIVEVLQKGYKIGDTLIRSAMVKVAN